MPFVLILLTFKANCKLECECLLLALRRVRLKIHETMILMIPYLDDDGRCIQPSRIQSPDTSIWESVSANHCGGCKFRSRAVVSRLVVVVMIHDCRRVDHAGTHTELLRSSQSGMLNHTRSSFRPQRTPHAVLASQSSPVASGDCGESWTGNGKEGELWNNKGGLSVTSGAQAHVSGGCFGLRLAE